MNNGKYFIPSSFLARKKHFSFDLSHLDRKVCMLQLLLEVRRGQFCSILPHMQSSEVGTNCMMKGFVVHYEWRRGGVRYQPETDTTRGSTYGMDFEQPIIGNHIP